jgi:hypothetical protein
MAEPTEQTIRSPQSYTFVNVAQLTALNYRLDSSLLVSNKTNIQYYLPSYLSADNAVRMVPVVQVTQDGGFGDPQTWFYIRSTVLPTDVDGKSSLDRFLADPNIASYGFTRFPPIVPATSPLARMLSGIIQANDKNPKYVILPKWCSDELSTLELRVGANAKNFTTVLSDKIQTPSGEISRALKLLEQLVPAGENAPEIQAFTQQSIQAAQAEIAKLKPQVDNLIALNAIYQSKDQAKIAVLNQKLKPEQIQQLQAAYIKYTELVAFVNVKSKTIEPVQGVKAQYVGRETCLNLLDIFVKQVPGVTSHVGTFTFPEPAAGFTPFVPTYESVPVTTTQVVLEDTVKDSVKRFLEDETCKSSAKRIISITTGIRKEITENGYDKFRNKFFNLSTCQFGEATGTGKIRGEALAKFLPDTNIPLKISIYRDDIARLLPPTSKDYDNKVLALFNYFGDEILKRLKEFKPEENLEMIPFDILEKIPEGVKPAVKTHVTTTAAFIIPTVPLSEVSIVNLPTVSGNKCLPSLAAKKRQLRK